MAKKFAGFTDDQALILLNKVGFTGQSMQSDEVSAFLASNPAAQAKLGQYAQAAQKRLNMLTTPTQRYAPGGLATLTDGQAFPPLANSELNKEAEFNQRQNELKTEYNMDDLSAAASNANETIIKQYGGADAIKKMSAEQQAIINQQINNDTSVMAANNASQKIGNELNKYGTPELDAFKQDTVLQQNELYKLQQGYTSIDPTDTEAIAAAEAAIESQKIKVTNALASQQTASANFMATNMPSKGEANVAALTNPLGMSTTADVADIVGTADQKIDTTTGQLTGPSPTATLTTATSGPATVAPVAPTVSTVTADTSKAGVKDVLDNTTAAKGAVSDSAQSTAQEGTISAGGLAATDLTVDSGNIVKVDAGTREVTDNEIAKAQGLEEEAIKSEIAQATMPDNIKAAQTTVLPEELPDAAQIAEADMAQAAAITDDGLAPDAIAIAAKLKAFTVDAGTLAEFKEGKIEAQDTVQGQLSILMQSFDDGTPAWAAGSMRAANAAMASRGLGGSSMAASAIVQAAMESAVPIAKADADAFREMKMDNLTRQQEVSLSNAAAQQGVQISNFTAEQQVALQNSQNAFTLQTTNLSNSQTAAIANAQIKAALQGQNLTNQQQSNIAIAARYAEVSNLNLNNRQQGLIQDSANKIQVDIANMNSKQQAYIANAQLAAALQGKQIDNMQATAITNSARYADANNLTYTAKQQEMIHNSELMKTIGIANLNSKQAATLQNAITVASMDTSNLNNRQQSAVQNAKAFLEMDLQNLDNEQQTAIFKSQAMVDTLLSDTAEQNAAKQFNATSENQTNQFYDSLTASISQHNLDQSNAMSRYNAGEANATSQFDATVKNNRDQYNSSNSLIVEQANTQWMQTIATTNNASLNAANRDAAISANGLTATAYNNLLLEQRDIMSYAFQTANNNADRATQLATANISADASITMAELSSAADKAAGMASAAGSLLGSAFEGAMGGDGFITKLVFG